MRPNREIRNKEVALASLRICVSPLELHNLALETAVHPGFQSKLKHFGSHHFGYQVSQKIFRLPSDVTQKVAFAIR